jgi:hypothetical protein
MHHIRVEEVNQTTVIAIGVGRSRTFNEHGNPYCEVAFQEASLDPESVHGETTLFGLPRLGLHTAEIRHDLHLGRDVVG